MTKEQLLVFKIITTSLSILILFSLLSYNAGYIAGVNYKNRPIDVIRY